MSTSATGDDADEQAALHLRPLLHLVETVRARRARDRRGRGEVDEVPTARRPRSAPTSRGGDPEVRERRDLGSDALDPRRDRPEVETDDGEGHRSGCCRVGVVVVGGTRRRGRTDAPAAPWSSSSSWSRSSRWSTRRRQRSTASTAVNDPTPAEPAVSTVDVPWNAVSQVSFGIVREISWSIRDHEMSVWQQALDLAAQAFDLGLGLLGVGEARLLLARACRSRPSPARAGPSRCRARSCGSTRSHPGPGARSTPTTAAIAISFCCAGRGPALAAVRG